LLRLLPNRLERTAPWYSREVDSTHNSLISVTNAGKKPTDAVLTFHYNHGQNQYEIRRTIAAGDQLWLNMGDLVRNQLPDVKGRTLPADLTSGTYEIREPGRNNDPSVFEGKIIVDKAYGHLAYGCTTCCADGYPGIQADPDILEWNASDDLYVIAVNSCTGYNDDLTGQFSGWGTDNSSVATMNSNQVTGVGPGTAHALSSGSFNYNNGVSKYCQIRAANPSNVTDVQVPDHIEVLTDVFQTINCGSNPSTQFRTITYRLDDASGNIIRFPVKIRENVPTNLTTSCNGSTVLTGATCYLNTTAVPYTVGEFADGLSPGCPNSPSNSPCGFTFNNQQWQYCPIVGQPTSIGTIGRDVVQNTLISVDGNTIGFPVGTKFPK